MSVWDSTSELECSFASLRLFASGVKASMTEANQDFYMKVGRPSAIVLVLNFTTATPQAYTDAPAPAAIATVSKVSGQVVHRPSATCLKVMQKYRDIFGGAAKNDRKTALPRRLVA